MWFDIFTILFQWAADVHICPSVYYLVQPNPLSTLNKPARSLSQSEALEYCHRHESETSLAFTGLLWI